MFLARTALIALQLVRAATQPLAEKPTDLATNASSRHLAPPLSQYSEQAEQELFTLANAARSRAGLPPLKLDDALVQAARAHAGEMAAHRQLAHQFSGEPPLSKRVGAETGLQLERAGENVAFATSPEQAHEALMSSPPHRDNLLSRKFDVAGFGVVEEGGRLYVAQDFASSVPIHSVRQAEELVARSIEQVRAKVNLPRLEYVSDRSAHSRACAMAEADSLKVAIPRDRALVLRYTSTKPETLPTHVSQVIARRGLHAYSAGSCYAHTERYPLGTYWVLLLFY